MTQIKLRAGNLPAWHGNRIKWNYHFDIVLGLLAFLFLAGCSSSPPAVQPGDATSYYMRGKYYQDHGIKPAQAVADYTTAIDIDPNYVNAYVKRAFANMIVDCQASVRDFDKAIELLPEDPALYYWRAYVHIMNDDIDQSLADYDTVIAKKPSSREAYWSYFKKALALESSGKISAAIEAYEEFMDKAGSPPVTFPPLDARTVIIGGTGLYLFEGVLPALSEPSQTSKRNRAQAQNSIESLTEILRMYDKMGEDAALSKISIGMNKYEVYACTLRDGYYMTIKPEVVAAVNRSGNLETRIFSVLKFKDQALVSKEDFLVSQLVALPIDYPQVSSDSLWHGGIDPSMKKSEVHERLEQNGKVIFEDDNCIAAVVYLPVVKGKRLIVSNFADGKFVSQNVSSRKLW